LTVSIVALLWRRAGMSRAEFRAYYETHHRLVGEQVLGGYATRYVRRFLTPRDGALDDTDPDVVTEIDFPDAATRDACLAAMAEPATMAMIVADDEQLFDRSRIRMFDVEECASELPSMR
jgi:EthD domain